MVRGGLRRASAHGGGARRVTVLLPWGLVGVIALGLWLARPFQIQGDSMRGARLPGDFVLGDNREDSEDSRFWGPVEEEQVTGRSVAVYWSWDARQERPRWRRFPRCLR